MRVFASIACGLILSTSACLHAADAFDPTKTKVQLDARAAEEVDNDSMRATLIAEIEESDASRAAEQVNRASRDAVGQLKRYSELKIRSGAYSTFPITEKGRIVRWRSRAEVVVEGKDFARVSDAIARVQGRMQLGGVEFFVSPARRAEVEAQLTQSAIAEFLGKARRVAQGFQGSDFHVTEATVSSDGAMPPPRPMMMRSMAESAAPQFEGGTSTVGVSVSGTVVITR